MKKPLPNSIRKSIKLPKTFILLVSLTCTYFLAEAQNQTAKVTPGGTWYYEYLPPDYNSNTNNYPIVFFLHGLGERGDTESSLSIVARNGPPKYVKAGYKFPFILISPQLKTNKTGWPNSYIDEVIEYVRNNSGLRVDQTRIYLTGLSLGGGGTWGYIQDPILGKKIAASVICCGHQNNPGKACNIVANAIPIWAFHGDADQTVSVSKTINMVNAINACVPAPNPLAMKTIYPGIGHNCWDNAYVTSVDLVKKLPDLTQSPLTVYQWLLQFKNGGTMVLAGPDITLNQPLNSTTITAIASTETGAINSYTWTKVSGPSATITNGSSPTVTLTNLNIAGVYTFRLTVTTDAGDSAYDDVVVTVVASVNQVPVANAGADKTITLPTNSLNLVGSGSDTDGTIATYLWTKVSGPTTFTLTNADKATASLAGLVAGTYVFQLTVTDDKGATASDQVTVLVNPAAVNQVPIANAGTDKTVNLPTSTLNITGSGSDADGTITTYLWTKISGPTVTITNANAATVSLSALVAGMYVFQLTVTDDKSATASDQVTVTVIAANQSPTANAGADITITLPTSTTNIIGSGTDPDGSISGYAWTFVSGPAIPTLVNASSTTVTANGLNTAGTYTFRLTVTDNNSATGFDDVKVIVNAMPVNIPPTANAGPDQSITLPVNTITLNGSGTDPDGGSITYAWIKVSGPTATLSNQATASLTANNLLAGTYVFRLTVTDNQSASKSDDVTVTVQPAVVNQLPVANAGADVILTLPANSTTLTGSGTDPDGTIATYAWIKLTGPATGTLSGQSTATLDLTNLVAGTYTFQLTVTDDKGATNSDAATVTVNAANIAPTANAGSDITITFAGATTNTIINGSGTDSDGSISSYAWSFISGPVTPTLVNAGTATLTANDLASVGTYTFRLTVTDNNSATGFDDVKVIVNAPANQAPTANAGVDQIITLPTASANFTGLGTDPDGTIASYAWTLLSSPASATAPTLTNANTATLTVAINDLVNTGDYTFRLVVTDDLGASDFDDVVLTVNPAAAVNQPPVANAGGNQSITLPLNSLNLVGSASDADGSIATYLWTLQSGPTATLTNADKPTVSLSNLLEGVYTFRLTVTDDGGLSAFAEATVTVLPAAVNQPPVANAGADQVISQTDVTIFGSGSDPDGTVVTYEWTFVTVPGGSTPVIGTPDKATTAITGLTPDGTYVLRLIVTDQDGSTDTDDVTITVNTISPVQPPVANAGTDKIITLPTNIATLSGSGSDPDGTIASYLWAKVSGPSVTLGVLNQPALSISDLVEGIYVFRLEVTDNDGNTDTDDVKVTVLPATINQSPVVVTDADMSIFLPTNTVTVTGSASDADGSIKSYAWTEVSGPAIAPADFVNASTTNLTVSNLVVGVYTFRLTATDNLDATGSDITKVTVFSDTVNQPPQANAGPDQTTKSTTVTLTGIGSDADGTIASYTWTKVSGPSCTLPPLNTATIIITGMGVGNYQFGLVVKDDKGKSSTVDLVNVTILPPAINTSPNANAGADQSVQLPANTADLAGSATDDGLPDPPNALTLQWEQVSGPSTVLSSPVATANVNLSNLVEGTYVFRFTANDGEFADSDDISIIVFPEPTVNVPPVVDAGDTIHITLPDNAVKLFASAQSQDGLIQSYKWAPDPQNISSVSIGTDTTAFLDVNGLSEGVYGFIVTVTDNDNQVATDEVFVIVETGPYNVFTPNNSGPVETETWNIGNSSEYTNCEINVYNRQGLRVFSSIGYPTPWNGTYNGQQLPEGVYFYVIGCPNAKAKTGTVTIIR
ncbi:MAG TPA: PKD domain-containing protein [Cyclobacteriaceae bacterium]